MRFGITSSAMAAALTGLSALTNSADAADFRFNLNIGNGNGYGHRHYSPPVHQRVWCAPVYETRVRRVWCEPVYETRCREVYCPAVTRCETYSYLDHCGRWVTGTRTVIVVPAHTKTIHEQVMVRPGHWNTVTEQVCVQAGFWR